MKTTVIIFLAALMIFLMPDKASAQQPACTARATVLDHLSRRYAEKPVTMGMANNGGAIEVLTTDDGSTWTIILTMPNGMTCMIAAGENWQALPKRMGLGT